MHAKSDQVQAGSEEAASLRPRGGPVWLPSGWSVGAGSGLGVLQAFTEPQGAQKNQVVSKGENSLFNTPPCPSSHLTVPVCSIFCPRVSPSLPCSAFFSLLSLLLRAVPCNYLLFPSPCQEISSGFPWDAPRPGRYSTRSAHPSRSCSQSEGRMGLGPQSWGSAVPVSPAAQATSPCCYTGASGRKHPGSGKLKTEWTDSAHCWDYS